MFRNQKPSPIIIVRVVVAAEAPEAGVGGSRGVPPRRFGGPAAAAALAGAGLRRPGLEEHEREVSRGRGVALVVIGGAGRGVRRGTGGVGGAGESHVSNRQRVLAPSLVAKDVATPASEPQGQFVEERGGEVSRTPGRRRRARRRRRGSRSSRPSASSPPIPPTGQGRRSPRFRPFTLPRRQRAQASRRGQELQDRRSVIDRRRGRR